MKLSLAVIIAAFGFLSATPSHASDTYYARALELYKEAVPAEPSMLPEQVKVSGKCTRSYDQNYLGSSRICYARVTDDPVIGDAIAVSLVDDATNNCQPKDHWILTKAADGEMTRTWSPQYGLTYRVNLRYHAAKQVWLQSGTMLQPGRLNKTNICYYYKTEPMEPVL